jgi:hypothetical protein
MQSSPIQRRASLSKALLAAVQQAFRVTARSLFDESPAATRNISQRTRRRTITSVRRLTKERYRCPRISPHDRAAFPILNALEKIEAQFGNCGYVTRKSLLFERCDVVVPTALCERLEHLRPALVSELSRS